ncbi:MAG: hemerythrin domain-containing protein [Gemmatimonadaceae bacterium]
MIVQPRLGTRFECSEPMVSRIEAVAARVRLDHAIIRSLLDAVERACTAAHAQRPETVRRTVWDLYVAFEDHLRMEEADVVPILRNAGATGDAQALAMILEHNEQRDVILELVEDVERDAKEAEALVGQAMALVHAFRTDMVLEERALGSLLADGAGHPSPRTPC